MTTTRAKVENAIEWVNNEEENLKTLTARHRREREEQHAHLGRARKALVDSLAAAEHEDVTRKQHSPNAPTNSIGGIA